ncbi:MAG: MaoC family dehydratase [Deltaproteobacteria bacterium]|nr:MaoC family dehydratase [Deltaproteobacteria bacterium]
MGESGPTIFWEDFPVGKVRETASATITREEVVAFGRQFDPQPFHVDEAAAARSRYGGLIASGWHTCSLAMRLYYDAVLRHAASQGSPGLEQVRWLLPVRPGDVLRVRVEVLEARPSGSKPELGLVRSRWRMLNQRDEAVMEMEGWGMFRRRSA